MSADCLVARSSTRALTAREVDAHAAVRVAVGRRRAAAGCSRTPSSADSRDLGHHLGRRDQRLGRDASGEHGRAAETLVLDERHRAAELARDERRLVAARPSADDHHPVHAPSSQGRRNLRPGGPRHGARTGRFG